MTLWFTKEKGADVAHSVEDASMVLHGDITPDYVALPPELGSRRLKVLRSGHAPCRCGTSHTVLWHELEDGYRVAECDREGFLWCREKETP